MKAGNEVEVEEQDGTLVIGPAATTAKKKEITVEITETNRHDIHLILAHLYRMGFDVIKLKGVSAGLMGVISTVVKDQLLGFEITERDAKHCTVTNISEPTEEKYEVLLRRVFLIIKETQAFVKQDFKTGKFGSFKEIEELRKQQDKFVYFCLRILTRERGQPIDWELLKFLMHIEHAYYYLYAYAAEHPFKPSSRVIELLDGLEQYFQIYYDAFYKKDMTMIYKMHKLKSEYQYGKCYRYLEQSKGRETIVLAHIRELFRLIQIGASPILSGLFETALE